MQIQQENIRKDNLYFIGFILKQIVLLILDAQIKGLHKLVSLAKRKLLVLNANKSNRCIRDYAPQYLAKREAKSNKIPLDKKRWTKSKIQSSSDFH